jgi:hypothetical protein
MDPCGTPALTVFQDDNFIRDLITEHQSGFTINDSTRNQLLYIANMFSKALDEGKEIRVIFFDISKAPFASLNLKKEK